MKKSRRSKSSKRQTTFFVIFLFIVIALCLLYLISTTRTHHSPFKMFSSNQLVSYFPTDEKTPESGDVLFDTYTGPSKNDNIHVRSKGVPGGIPINVSTRAVDADYRQIGIVSRKGGQEQIFPLIGKPLYTHRDKWQYYVLNKQNIKLPIMINGKNSTNEYGADSLDNSDHVSISGYPSNTPFEVVLYENTQHQYIPF